SSYALGCGRNLRFPKDPDLGALVHADHLGSGGAIGRDLQVSHAADDHEQLTRDTLRVAGLDLTDLVLADDDLERRRIRLEELRHFGRGEVGDEISEAVGLEDYPLEQLFVHWLRLGSGKANEIGDLFAELRDLDSLAQPSRDGGEDVAPVKG